MTTMIKLSDNYYVRASNITAVERANEFKTAVPGLGPIGDSHRIIVRFKTDDQRVFRFNTKEERDAAFNLIIQQL